MAGSIGERLKKAWNVFMNKDPTQELRRVENGYYYRPDRPRLVRGGERSIIASLYNRISLDCASIDVKHVRLDDSGRYISDIDSDLNKCLTVEANIDQTNRAFIQDIVLSMLDEGVVAVVPIDTTSDPFKGSFDIQSMRVGKVIQWYPDAVKVTVYNDRNGRKEDILVPKRTTVIVENPFYSVMNETNSTLQRLIRKLALLDQVDEASGSGKLDMIIQLPYVIKTENQRKQADLRREEIERQLTGSKYGIAYTDGTEKIQQLGKPLENNLLKQIEYLTDMVYSQLGMTPEILNGSASTDEMINYQNRTVEPIVASIVAEMHRKWLTKTARTQHQAIKYFNDPFKLVPIAQVAEMADKFTRNEIMTSNEFRQVIGMKPSNDPKADMLINSNINQDPNSLAEHEEAAEGDIQSDPMRVGYDRVQNVMNRLSPQGGDIQ